MENIKAVIFDMDGVIVESEFRNYKAKLKVLEPYNVTFDYEYYSQFPGNSNIVVWQKIIEDFSIPVTAEEMHKVDLIARDDLIKQEGHIAIDGALELIKKLSKKYVLALASGSPKHIIEDTVKFFDIEKYFKFIISGETIENCKPAPDIFLITAKNIGINPENCVVIEDSANGVMAAKSAGMKCIGYENENSGKQDLSLADLIIKDHKNNPL
ncbi:MAG: HAD family phosphatase [Clostridia bacterium]|nr:HAD family phosphatase [Clostridia bacterium]